MKVYYAHCQAIYGTPQEQRDVKTLEELGFEVVNPGLPEHSEACQEWATQHTSNNKMGYFLEMVDDCDVLAFRALPDGAIPMGVAAEIERAKFHGKPVFELPSGILRREITLAQTREYLYEIGQR